MEGWLPDLSGFPGPKYQAIADALAGAITVGDLKSGDRLPPQRNLASRLGCDLTTVTRGYELARQRGLIIGRGRAGGFVRHAAKASMSAAMQMDTALNTPPVPPGSVLQSAYSKCSSIGVRGGWQSGAPGSEIPVRSDSVRASSTSTPRDRPCIRYWYDRGGSSRVDGRPKRDNESAPALRTLRDPHAP